MKRLSISIFGLGLISTTTKETVCQIAKDYHLPHYPYDQNDVTVSLEKVEALLTPIRPIVSTTYIRILIIPDSLTSAEKAIVSKYLADKEKSRNTIVVPLTTIPVHMSEHAGFTSGVSKFNVEPMYHDIASKFINYFR